MTTVDKEKLINDIEKLKVCLFDTDTSRCQSCWQFEECKIKYTTIDKVIEILNRRIE